MDTENLKWYQKKNGIIILLILFFPVGLYQMWKYSNYWSKKTKTIITIIISLIVVLSSNKTSNLNKSSNSSKSSDKCLLVGCNNLGNGWIHSSQSSEMKLNNLYGVYRIKSSGGYCSKSHGEQDN